MENTEVEIQKTKSEIKQTEKPDGVYISSETVHLICWVVIFFVAIAFVKLWALRKRKETSNESPFETISQEAVSNKNAIRDLRREFESFRESSSKISNVKVMDVMEYIEDQQKKIFSEFSMLREEFFALRDKNRQEIFEARNALTGKVDSAIHQVHKEFLQHMETTQSKIDGLTPIHLHFANPKKLKREQKRRVSS